MCWFIVVLLPTDTDLEKLKPIYTKYKMNFYSGDCWDGLATTRPNDKCISPGLHPMCDCGTALGSWNDQLENWKKHKEDYDSDTINAEVMAKGIDVKHGDGSTSKMWHDIPLWMGFLTETLEKKLVSHIGLYYHLDDNVAPWNVKEVRRISRKEITQEILLKIEEDILYEFVPD